jgi:hypothetical protein
MVTLEAPTPSAASPSSRTGPCVNRHDGLPLPAPSPPRCRRAGALADGKAELITTATERERLLARRGLGRRLRQVVVRRQCDRAAAVATIAEAMVSTIDSA